LRLNLPAVQPGEHGARLHRVPFLDMNGGECAGKLAVDSNGPNRLDCPSRANRAGSGAELSDGEVDQNDLGTAGAPPAPPRPPRPAAGVAASLFSLPHAAVATTSNARARRRG
jgi:hypothetical protein